MEVDTAITSERLIRVFERLRKERGLPQVLRTDNGPEFLGDAFTQWATAASMAIQYIQPGKPNQNAYIERFKRTMRNELLDQHLFVRLDDVAKLSTGGCPNTTNKDPMTRSAIWRRSSTHKPPETLVSNCRLDGEDYALMPPSYF